MQLVSLEYVVIVVEILTMLLKLKPRTSNQHLHLHLHTSNKTHPFSISESIIFLSHHNHISGNGTVCNTGPLNNRSTNSGHNGSSFSSSSDGIGVNLKSLGVCGMGIGVDFGMGVIGGDGGIIVVLWWMMMLVLLLLLNEEGESDPIRVLNRGFRIRGEGRVVEGLSL